MFPEFDLGKLQTGGRIDDVELPAWAESPEEFIVKHREALVGSFLAKVVTVINFTKSRFFSIHLISQ